MDVLDALFILFVLPVLVIVGLVIGAFYVVSLIVEAIADLWRERR